MRYLTQSRVRLFVMSAITMLFVFESEAASRTHYTVRFFRESGFAKELRSFAFSPDSRILAIATGNNVAFVATTDGNVRQTVKHNPFAMGYSRNGSRILMLSEREQVLLDSRTLRAAPPAKLTIERGFVGLFLEQRNGKLLTKSLSPEGPVDRLGKVNVGDELVSFGEGASGAMRRLLGDNPNSALERLRGPAGSKIRIGIIHRGELEPKNYLVKRQAVQRIDGKVVWKPLPTGPANEHYLWTQIERRHALWNASTGEVDTSFSGVAISEYGQNAISPDGKMMAAVGKRKDNRNQSAIEVYNTASGDPVSSANLRKTSWNSVTFLHDSERVIVGTWDTVEVFAVPSGEFIASWPLSERPVKPPQPEPKAERSGGSLAQQHLLSSEKTFGASESEHWSNQRLCQVLAASSRGVFATGDPFGQVKLWSSTDGRHLLSLKALEEEEVEDILFSPDGHWLAYFVKGVLHLVDVSDISVKTPSPWTRKQ